MQSAISELNPNFIFPKYKNNCFSNIPATVLNLFGIKKKKPTVSKKYFEKYLSKRYKNIVLFLIDALGFYQWKQYANKYPLFKKLDKKRFLYPITSVFPSTTASALNTLSSGLTPAEHGLFEWTLYLPEIDKTIETLPFKEIGKKRDSLLKENVDPKILFNAQTIFGLLKRNKISSFMFLNKVFANSTYSKLYAKGSLVSSFTNFSDLVVNFKNQLIKSQGRNYFFVYWDKLDSLGHDYGPKSDACKAELSKISHLFLTEFIKKLNEKTKKQTLLIITADHGQIDVNPQETIYLNKDKKLISSLQKDRKGEIIFPTGSARDAFLHVKETELKEIHSYLEKKLKNKADIIKTSEAVKFGLFGGKVKPKFKDRLGNLTILPYKNYTIWREFKNKKFKHLGHHGGLTKEEMLIPFSICKLDEIS